jgi:hypothetical protein
MTGPDSPKVRQDDGVQQPSERQIALRPGAEHGALLHPIEWLGATSFGSAAHDEIRSVLTHAAECLACRSLLARDDEIRRRLALLRKHEPQIDVLEQVMRRIDDEA